MSDRRNMVDRLDAQWKREMSEPVTEKREFTPEVREAFCRLSDVVDSRNVEDFAPPEHRPRGHRAASYDLDMERMKREIEIEPKENLRICVRRLTYGEMMEVCQGILAATSNRPITTKEELAEVIDRWAAQSLDS